MREHLVGGRAVFGVSGEEPADEVFALGGHVADAWRLFGGERGMGEARGEKDADWVVSRLAVREITAIYEV